MQRLMPLGVTQGYEHRWRRSVYFENDLIVAGDHAAISQTICGAPCRGLIVISRWHLELKYFCIGEKYSMYPAHDVIMSSLVHL